MQLCEGIQGLRQAALDCSRILAPEADKYLVRMLLERLRSPGN